MNLRITLQTLALAALLPASALYAQTSGKLRLQIEPAATFTYRLDHQFTMDQREVELLEGPHHFSFWAPQRRIVDTTLTVVGGQTKEFQLRLPFSTDYLIYQRELRRYRSEKQLSRIVPSVITGGAILSTALSYAKLKKAHDQLERDRKEYDEQGAPYRITVLKEQTIPADKEAFRKAKVQLGVSAGIMLLSAGITAYVFQKSGKVQRPEFIDREKLRFEGLSWVPGLDGGIWQGGLTWNLGR